ncbi:MAG: deoxyribonuclease V [Desulfuromonadales bacterium]|nr:deoxyribonuclease V [Desulfuromonadales bacterium]
MQFTARHPWDLTPQEAIALQKELAAQVVLSNDLPNPVERVAGVDVSYRLRSRRFHAAVVVLDYLSMDILETATASGEVDFPYIPGLLSFRELPILLQAFQNLEIVPNVILADGQGIAHPRRLGIASHLGLWLNLATIGCAKSRLCGEHEEPGPKKGDWTPLSIDGMTLGRVVRTRDGVRPLYLSCGHKIDLHSATDIVLHCSRGYRLPEPTRQAHLLSNRVRQEYEN